MPRTARLVIPGLPHHVTQRGVRRQPTFFCDDDYRLYLDLLAERCAREQVAIWAYRLMPNHVHLVAVPSEERGLAAALGGAHQRYTTRIYTREGWTGYLWQGRFASFTLDDAHLWCASRYVELNPVRAGMVAHPTDWPWSSARAHCGLGDDPVVQADALLDRFPDWRESLSETVQNEAEVAAIRQHERHGLPLGDERFVAGLEARLGKSLRRTPRGRPKRDT